MVSVCMYACMHVYICLYVYICVCSVCVFFTFFCIISSFVTETLCYFVKWYEIFRININNLGKCYVAVSNSHL